MLIDPDTITEGDVAALAGRGRAGRQPEVKRERAFDLEPPEGFGKPCPITRHGNGDNRPLSTARALDQCMVLPFNDGTPSHDQLENGVGPGKHSENRLSAAYPAGNVSIGDLEAGVRFSRTMEDGVSAQYFEMDGIFTLAGDTERDDRLRLGTGITVPDPWLGGILDLGLRLDGLAGDDWQAYGVKFGYGLAPIPFT